MTTKAEYAQMSLYVYQALRSRNRPAAPTGWAQLELSSEAIDGFSYGVFRRIGTNEVVVAYTGTNQSVDWIANLTNGIGLVSATATSAARVYLQAKQAYGSDITLTGHSLGGGLAGMVAVWFDRPAWVFDNAPFELSVRNVFLLPVIKSALGAGGYSDPAFTSYTGLLDFGPREENVAGYYTSGEVLARLRLVTPDVVGPINEEVKFGIANMTDTALPFLRDPIKLHSMALLTAGLMSEPFRQATVAVQRTLPLLFADGFYNYDSRESDEQDILVNLVRGEQGAGKKLTHFAADLQKIGANIAGLSTQAQDALIAQSIEWYYFQSESFSGEFFTGSGALLQYTTALGAELPQAQNKAADYVNKWLAPVVAAAGEVNQTFVSRYFDQWSIAANADAVTASARDTDKRQIYVGQDGGDNFTGGNKSDLLIGGAGSDTLNGGKGDDSLYGGAGSDRYAFDADWGNDTVIDSGGDGVITVAGVAAVDGGGAVKQTGVPGAWRTADKNITYSLVERCGSTQRRRQTRQARPGMNLTAEIKTGQRWVIDYLLSPVQQAADESLRER